MTRYPNLFERIISKCISKQSNYVDTPCWHHTGSCCRKQYPYVSIWCKVRKITIGHRAHIVLWELVNGRKVREGYTLDHLCLNTRCVRPDHLEEVTRAKNTARGNKTRKRAA